MNRTRRNTPIPFRRAAVSVLAAGLLATAATGACLTDAVQAGTAQVGTAVLDQPATAQDRSDGPPVKVVRIRGRARLDYPVPGDVVRIWVHARARFVGGSSFPQRSQGTFRIYHRVAEPEPGADPFVNWGDFRVDCLTAGGPTATVTGTLVRSSPGSIFPAGMKTGLSFYVPRKRSGDPARVGIAGLHEPPLTSCMAPAADAAVIEGGFILKDRR